MASWSPRRLHEVSLPSFLSQMTAKSSNSRKQLSGRLKEMAQLPNSEWDFRWIADEHEADHVGIFEAAREVVRVAAARSGCTIPVAMSKLASVFKGSPGGKRERKDLDWVIGVFGYLSFSQLSAGMFPGPAITSIDPSLELVDAMRKLRAVKVRSGLISRVEVPSSDLLFRVEPGISLEEAIDALEFQFKIQRFELKDTSPAPGRHGTPILRALSFYRYSMGRSATNLYLDFEQELDATSTFKPGRPLTEFGEQLYKGIRGSNTNDPVNLWSAELARFENYFESAELQMIGLLKARN
jgi:hypothetical protein